MNEFKLTYVVIFIVFLAGCSSNVTDDRSPDEVTISTVSTSGGYVGGSIHSTATSRIDYRTPSVVLINTFFATDRNHYMDYRGKNSYGESRSEISYGMTKVSIPMLHHKKGVVESPSLWRFEFRENPDRHVVLLDVVQLKNDSFFNKINDHLKEGRRSAFIFVHGFNVTFEDAARRTAQMTYDLKFKGIPIFYSWPSSGSMLKYPSDEGNVEWSKNNIKYFLRDFLKKTQAENVYLLAHSMGNRALIDAYIDVENEYPNLGRKIKEVILAAPDIDAEVFKNDIVPALAGIGKPVTLYASSEDIPLKLSKEFHGGYPRAGDSGNSIIIAPGIETVDVTGVTSGFWGHSYLTEEKTILTDLFYIINHDIRANERASLNPINTRRGMYWKLIR
ncbi:alpha/beta hydrolase [Photobacterium galatheae]|nr:alpha/beta hydrolase [Photobacterium galatheae]MCM0150323.1 alpha/beta hydrolase [Photobacterium galatheae]